MKSSEDLQALYTQIVQTFNLFANLHLPHQKGTKLFSKSLEREKLQE